MLFRKLGGTDIDVRAICLGTMTWGSQNSEAESHAQIDRALDRGVNFIDTAEGYPTTPVSLETQGRTEKIIGSWIAGSKRRDQIVLASKVAGPSRDIRRFRVATTASTVGTSCRPSMTASPGCGPTISISTSCTGRIAPPRHSASEGPARSRIILRPCRLPRRSRRSPR